MNPEIWSRVGDLFEAALDLPAEQRERFVEEQVNGDEELQTRVLELLAADAQARGFLSQPVVRVGPPPAPEDERGERVGPYRLIRLVGRGGMGAVYLAERVDDQYQRRVAIKMLPRGVQSQELLERFYRERQVLAHLEHPNIARLYDGSETDDGRPYLVMELIEGLPIDQHCDRQRLSIPERLQLFLRVCAAVEHAHRSLLVHRDLKPANILVTPDGTPKLLDFGIAKLLADDQPDGMQPTQGGDRPMTPLFASPEQLRGEAITTASDVYSLGVLLHLLLSGQGPYRRDDPSQEELERAVRDEPPLAPSVVVGPGSPTALEEVDSIAEARGTTPRALYRHLRGDLDAIAIAALEKETARRYGSARELAADIERHLDHRPVRTRTASLAYRLGRFARRNALAVGAAGTLAILVLGFAVVTSFQATRLAQERDTARNERAKAEQVSDLLLRLFEESDPFSSNGGDTTVREVLDRGAAEIESLKTQPEVQAAAMHTIGRAYRGLALYEPAASHLEAALSLRQELHAGDHPEVAATLQELAMLRRAQGEYATAEGLLRQALTMREHFFGNDHPSVAEALNELALVVYDLGDQQEAESLLRRALAICRALPAEEELLSTTLNNLALAVHYRGNYEGAEPLYREALAIKRRLHPGDHIDVAIYLNNLGTLLHDQERFQEAELLYRESLGMRRHLLGDEHPHVTTSLGNLAFLLYESGNPEAARPLLLDVLQRNRLLLGEEHPRVAATMVSLARLDFDQGEIAAAQVRVRAALAILREKLPEGHWRLASGETVLGACLTRTGRYHEAEPLLVESYSILHREIGERESRTRYALDRLIEHYDARGMEDEAAEYRALRALGE